MRRNPIGLAGFWFRGTPPDGLARLLVRLGATGLDYWPWNRGNLPLAEFRRLAEDNGIAIFCVNLPSTVARVADPDRPAATGPGRDVFLQAMDAAVALGASAVQVYSAVPAVRTAVEAADELVRDITPLLAEASDRGLTIRLENNLDQRGEDPDGLNPSRRVVALRHAFAAVHSGQFDFCYDPANFVATGEDAFPAGYDALQPWMGNVHLKDCRRYTEEHDVNRPEAARLLVDALHGPFLPCPVNEGSVPWPAVLDRLAADQYEGWLTLDPFISDQLLVPWCERSMANLRALLDTGPGAPPRDTSRVSEDGAR